MSARNSGVLECEDCGAIYEGALFIIEEGETDGEADRCPFCGGETDQ